MNVTIRFGQAGDDGGAFRRRFGGETGQVQVEVDGGISTVREVLSKLIELNPEAKRFVDDEGQVRRFMLVYVQEEDIRFLRGLDTPIVKGEEVFITTAICFLFYQLIEQEFLMPKPAPL